VRRRGRWRALSHACQARSSPQGPESTGSCASRMIRSCLQLPPGSGLGEVLPRAPLAGGGCAPGRLPSWDVFEQGDDGVVEVLAQFVVGKVLLVVEEDEQEAEQGAEGTVQADPYFGVGSRVGQQAGEAGGIAGKPGADVGIVGESSLESVLVPLEGEEQLVLGERDVGDLRECPLPGGGVGAGHDEAVGHPGAFVRS